MRLIMTTRYLDVLKATLGDFRQIKPEQMQNLLKETLEVFRELQEKMKSNDPAQQEEAKEYALKIREELNQQAERLMAETGLTMSDLTEFAKNNPVSQDTSDMIKKEFEQIKLEIGGPQKVKPPKKTKMKPLWMAG